MIDKLWIFILGSQDPEMREIERTLRRHRYAFFHAAKGHERCTPRTAYEADTVVRVSRTGQVSPVLLLPNETIVFVECTVDNHVPVMRADHHYSGDPGYEKSPDAYLQGSSLGQVLSLLEIEPSATQRLIAAGDHCLTAAYQGACPGVDPHELLFLRASWQAKTSGRSISDVVEGILRTAKDVCRRYDSDIGEAVFLDPTEAPPDLAEGAAYAGKPIRYRELLPSGEVKEMLKGAAIEDVERFIDKHRAAGRHVYGNPYRGYAGAYCT
jgi:hypothetical protein